IVHLEFWLCRGGINRRCLRRRLCVSSIGTFSGNVVACGFRSYMYGVVIGHRPFSGVTLEGGGRRVEITPVSLLDLGNNYLIGLVSLITAKGPPGGYGTSRPPGSALTIIEQGMIRHTPRVA